MFWVLVSVFTIFPIITFAESITNLNGIVISEEEYNNFLKLYPQEYIMTIDEAKYEKLKSLDYGDIKTEEVYVETVHNRNLLLTSDIQISKEQYDNYEVNGSGVGNAVGEVETTVKRLYIAVAAGTKWHFVTSTATWKGIPTVRSFDVIGIYGVGFEIREGSQTGTQYYKINGKTNWIDYHWNGTNIKKADDGFGISMNLINEENIESLNLTIDCDVEQTLVEPTLLASYQHAITNLTLAKSQSYTFNAAGLGGVFEFPYDIAIRYDGMSGARIQY